MTDPRDIYSTPQHEHHQTYRSSSSSGGVFWPVVIAAAVVVLLGVFFIFAGSGDGTAPPDINPAAESSPQPTQPSTSTQ